MAKENLFAYSSFPQPDVDQALLLRAVSSAWLYRGVGLRSGADWYCSSATGRSTIYALGGQKTSLLRSLTCFDVCQLATPVIAPIAFPTRHQARCDERTG